MLQCPVLDQAVATRILEVITPHHVELALASHEELEKRDEFVTRQWRMRLQRAQYEAELAQRRYEEVDPSNRLVATSLERRWNEALQRVDEVEQQMREFQTRQTRTFTFTPEQRVRIQSLAIDLPRLWNSSSTSAKDRKRILRLLLEDITVHRSQRQAQLQIRWSGGACEELAVLLPPKAADRLRYPIELIEQVRRLAAAHQDAEIADQLNQIGHRSSHGKPFNTSMVRWIRYKHGIATPERRIAGELSVQQVAQKFNVSHGVVHYWIDRGIIRARQDKPNQPYWITLTQQQEIELIRWVQNSIRIKTNTSNTPNVC